MERSSRSRSFSQPAQLFAALFREMDRDSTGLLSRADLRHGLSRAGLSLRNEELQWIFARLDVNQNGKIGRKEFVEFMEGAEEDSADKEESVLRKLQERAATVSNYKAWFREIDVNSSGFLDKGEMRRALSKLSIHLS